MLLLGYSPHSSALVFGRKDNRVLEGLSASKCLSMAMKVMRESDRFSDVKHWAPFVLIGDDVTFNFYREAR